MTDENKKMLLDAGIDFDGIAARIPLKEDFLLRMLGKYPGETCFSDLEKAMGAKDYEDAFRHAHNLKGVTGNLEMTRLHQVTTDLVEKLRAHNYEGVDEDFSQIKEAHERAVEAIGKLLSA